MFSLKPGRGPSGLSAIFGIVAVLFGIGWTIIAFAMTRTAPFPVIRIIFPLFGVLFVVVGIVNVIYNLKNTVGEKRFSSLDITSDSEEPDPLNTAFGGANVSGRANRSVEERLRDLDQLKNKGSISEAEYQEQRKRVLNDV